MRRHHTIVVAPYLAIAAGFSIAPQIAAAQSASPRPRRRSP